MYNVEPYLHQAIKSILSQTYRDFEFIILDDGSTDNSIAIVESYNDPRIRLIRSAHIGRAMALNSAIGYAKAEILALMDADDLCIACRFEKQLSILNNLPKDTLLSSWYGVFYGSTMHYYVTPPTTSREIKKGLLLHSYISHPALMLYKDTLVSEGGYRSSIKEQAFVDYETWLGIKDKIEFYIIPEILIYHRYRQNSLSNNIYYKQRIMYSIQQPYYNDLQAQFGISVKWEEYLYRGWREYFYGSKNKARNYWRRLGFLIYRHPRVILAWLTTFMPEHLFIQFKESRAKFRLMYLFFYYTNKSKILRNQLDTLLNE